MNKRGQATILIILGLVILVTVITVLVFKDRIFVSEFDKQAALSLQVPEQASELHDYLSECVQEVVEEPVNLVGQQGGYVNLPDDPIGQGGHNAFSNTLEIFPGTDFETAYWFYEAANGVPHIDIPTKTNIEDEIAEYVNSNVAACASNSTIFETHNASVGEIFTEVEILDDRVQVVVDYPVTINIDDFTFDFESFYQTVDSPLGEMHDAAVEIIEEENENFYLEELTYDIFVLYDDIPLSDSGLECETQEWEVEEIENSLKDKILNNILAVKVKKTSYEQTEDTDQKYFEWDALKTSADLRANLLYSKEWPFQLDVYPAEDGTLTEDSYTEDTGPFLSVIRNLFCINSYHFVYDLKYPVLVSLYDEDSDYTFQFATMVILDNNQPRENVEGTLELGVEESVICQDPTVPITIYPVEVASNGALLDLTDVELSFKCINSVCPIAHVQTTGGTTTLVPQCINGQIIAEKEGFQRGIEIIDTLEETTVTVILEQYQELNYDIKIVSTEGIVRTPTSEDTIFVTLVEKETGYTTTVSNPKNGETVQLIPGTYEIEGTLVTESSFDIIIPEYDYTTCTSVPQFSLGGLFGLQPDTSCTGVEVEEAELEQALSGGVSLTWVADRAELASASEVTFYVTSPGKPETIEEIEQVQDVLDTRVGTRQPELR
jgi:hypothetical protein